MSVLTPLDYSGGVLLALDGLLPDRWFIDALRPLHLLLVAADGAALRLRDMGVMPDVVIGDLDSIGTLRGVIASEGASVVEVPSQEENDFEKALQWIVERGERSATIIGIGGGMTDHALNNFSVLARYAPQLRLAVRDESSTAYALCETIEFDAAIGDRISLIPLPRARLRTSGLVWELADEVLEFGEREGASNRTASEHVRIEVGEGVVMVFHYSR